MSNFKTIYKLILENKKWNLKDVEWLSLEGKEFLNKNQIYQIAACLLAKKSDIDAIEEIISNKRKTWKKYIDYFFEIFNLKFNDESSTKIPIVQAIECVGTILLFENPEWINESKEKPKYITKIRRRINEDYKEGKDSNIKRGKFEQLLSYEEKNKMITDLERSISFYNSDFKRCGIGITREIVKENNTNEDVEFDILVHVNIMDINRFKEHQMEYKMLAEIEEYEDELYEFLSILRMRTALEEVRNRFINNVQELFRINAEDFLKELENEIIEKSTQLFELKNENGYNSNDLSKDSINAFNEYVQKEFDTFKEKWITESTNFSFDPHKLIKKGIIIV